MGAKLVCEKESGSPPQKNMNKNLKPEWEIRLETQRKNLRQQAKFIKQRQNAGACWYKKEKAPQEKNDNTTLGNKPENTGERRKIKKISRKSKTIQTKQNIPK